MKKEELEKMPYVDFVGYVNQWNVPPGSFSTVSKWKVFGGVSEKSKVLEIASTSGFSLREIAILSGCSGVGIDLSEPSVNASIQNAKVLGVNSIQYKCQNALDYKPTYKFSHIIIGAALKFFPEPQKVLSHITEFLVEDGGYVLASPFYAVKDVPIELIERCKKVFGITITTEFYETIINDYKGFEIIYEDRSQIREETDMEINFYCKSIIDNCPDGTFYDDSARKYAYKRLFEIKKTTNDLRKYQEYTVLVLRYRSKFFGKRFTELF